MASPKVKCTICENLGKSSLRAVVFAGELVKKTVAKIKDKNEEERRRKELNDFFKAINALLNEGGGVVCIHGVDPYLLGRFDQIVDDKMQYMIPDDSLYQDNYERNFEQNQDHVIFRVKNKTRPLSTLEFNTKASQNKGVVDLSQAQMRCLMCEFRGEGQPAKQKRSVSGTPPITPTFRKDGEVQITPGVFKEGVGIEVKSVPAKIPREYESDKHEMAKLANYLWDGIRIPHYISAFTKLPSGGSMFIGLREEKKEVAGKEEITGKIICEGLRLIGTEKSELMGFLIKKVVDPTLMLWLSRHEVQRPVEIVYHEVEEEKDFWVMEIKMSYVKGVSFYRNTLVSEESGPKAFKLRKLPEEARLQGPEECISLDSKEWVEKQYTKMTALSVNQVSEDEFPTAKTPQY